MGRDVSVREVAAAVRTLQLDAIIVIGGYYRDDSAPVCCIRIICLLLAINVLFRRSFVGPRFGNAPAQVRGVRERGAAVRRAREEPRARGSNPDAAHSGSILLLFFHSVLIGT